MSIEWDGIKKIYKYIYSKMNIEIEKQFKSAKNQEIDLQHAIFTLKGRTRITVNANSSTVLNGVYSKDQIYTAAPLILYSIQSNDEDCFQMSTYLYDVTEKNFKMALQNTSSVAKEITICYRIEPY